MVLGQFSFLDEATKDVLDDHPTLQEAVKTWRAANRDERKRVRIHYEPAPETADDEEKSSKSSRRTKGDTFVFRLILDLIDICQSLRLVNCLK